MEIVIPHDQRKIRRKYRRVLLILGLGIIILSIGIMIKNLIFFSLGCISTFLAGWSILIDFRKKNLPTLILNEKGIIDRIKFLRYGLIEWSDIIGFRIDEKFEDLIFIDVTDEDKYINKLNTTKPHGKHYKMDLKNNFYGYDTVVILNVKNLDGSTEEILKKLTDHWHQVKTTAETE